MPGLSFAVAGAGGEAVVVTVLAPEAPPPSGTEHRGGDGIAVGMLVAVRVVLPQPQGSGQHVSVVVQCVGVGAAATCTVEA